MRTFTTVKHSSRVNGRHSQKDIDLLTGTCDFILYLLPALLSLFSRTKHWALLQGSQRVSRQAAKATPLTHSVTGHLMQSPCTPKLSNQGVKPSRIKDGVGGDVSGGWVLRMSKASQPRLHCRRGQITLFGLFAWLQLKGPICKKVDFQCHLRLLKYWRWRTVGRPPSHIGLGILTNWNFKGLFYSNYKKKKKKKRFFSSDYLAMQMSSNYFWNSMLFIGLLAEVSEDITNALCIIPKLSAWLDATGIRVSSKKKMYSWNLGELTPKLSAWVAWSPWHARWVCLALELCSMDTAVDKETHCRMAHTIVLLNILDESLQRDWARALILIFMLYLYC